MNKTFVSECTQKSIIKKEAKGNRTEQKHVNLKKNLKTNLKKEKKTMNGPKKKSKKKKANFEYRLGCCKCRY